MALTAEHQTEPGDQEMMEAFGQMSSMWEAYQRQTEDENVSKKTKRETPPQANGAAGPKQVTTEHLLKAMSHLLLRLDSEQQQLKKQDSWVCFLQTDRTAVLPHLMSLAGQWKESLEKIKAAKDPLIHHPPLRCHLWKGLALTLQERLLKLSRCKEQDPLLLMALKHGILNKDLQFPFLKWNKFVKAMQPTHQPAVNMDRMLKYVEQLVDLSKDEQMVVRFQSMRPPNNTPVVPWLLQVSLRMDDLQYLLQALQGSTIWHVIGMQLKAHSLPHSKPAVALQELLQKTQQPGKGKGKSHHKGK